MKLVWDWRLARIYDAEGICIDEIWWSGNQTIDLIATRLSLISKMRMTDEARTLSQRFPEAIKSSPIESGVNWPALDEYEQDLLHEATLKLAARGVAATAHDPDRRLEHLVRAMDEIRTSQNTLESRIVEWAGLFLPTLDLDCRRSEIAPACSKASNLSELGQSLDTDFSDVELGKAEWASVHGWSVMTVELEQQIVNIELAVRELATSHLPSLSILLGPILAARLSVTAHGRARLARLPAGTIQILGAEKAFFTHIKQGTDPPKHGHIFQHPWICRNPRWIRGKISRMLAAKAAIAVRLDHFQGEPWTNKEITEIEHAVKLIREQHPSPSSRRR